MRRPQLQIDHVLVVDLQFGQSAHLSEGDLGQPHQLHAAGKSHCLGGLDKVVESGKPSFEFVLAIRTQGQPGQRLLPRFLTPQRPEFEGVGLEVFGRTAVGQPPDALRLPTAQGLEQKEVVLFNCLARKNGPVTGPSLVAASFEIGFGVGLGQRQGIHVPGDDFGLKEHGQVTFFVYGQGKGVEGTPPGPDAWEVKCGIEWVGDGGQALGKELRFVDLGSDQVHSPHFDLLLKLIEGLFESDLPPSEPTPGRPFRGSPDFRSR